LLNKKYKYITFLVVQEVFQEPYIVAANRCSCSWRQCRSKLRRIPEKSSIAEKQLQLIISASDPDLSGFWSRNQ